MTVQQQAVQYAQNHGLYLFPTRKNKAPLTQHGFKDATNQYDVIDRLFKYEGRGIGVHPGRSGYVVVDIDVKDGATGEDQWNDLGVDFEGPEVITPSGGRHLWFRKPEGMEFDNTSLDDSIDIRSDGGYVILPDSFEYRFDLGWDHVCGRCDFEHPSFEDAPVFPEILVNKLKEQKAREREYVAPDQPIPSGSRQETLFAMGMAMRARGVPERGIEASLRAVNEERCVPPLTDQRMRELMKGVMRSNMDYPVAPVLTRVRHSEGGPIVWQDLWDTEHPPVDWIPEMEGIAIAGRATNIYGPAGTGKSELVLHRAATAAEQGVRVLWLDREMTDKDVKDRLIEMGFAPNSLGSLTYILYPDLPLLDKEEGGEALVALADSYDAEVVVIDSLSKFVRDEEGETHTAFYIHTMLPMRLAGHAFVMIDHTGKDISRKARGASQKVDNVDYYTEITRIFGVGTKLTTKKQRHSWVQPEYTYRRSKNPLNYKLSAPMCVFNCGRLATRKGGPGNKWVCDECVRN